MKSDTAVLPQFPHINQSLKLVVVARAEAVPAGPKLIFVTRAEAG